MDQAEEWVGVVWLAARVPKMSDSPGSNLVL